MRRRNGQAALGFIAELLRNLFNAFNFAQNFASHLQNGLASRSDAGKVLAAAGKNLNPQLILQQTDLLTDARLRGIQHLGCCRHVEVVMRYLPDVSQLLQFHNSSLPNLSICYKNINKYSFPE